MAEIEFPKRPLTLEEIFRRPTATNDRSEREDGATARYDGSDGRTTGGFDMGNDNEYEVAMNSGANINLRRLQETLDRQPLDEIAMLVRALTYGEMIELAEGMWKVQPDGSAVTQENLPALLHRWSQSRAVPADNYTQPSDDYSHHQESDTD